MQKLFRHVSENRVRKDIVAVLNKPKSASEIRWDVGRRLDLQRDFRIERKDA